MAFFGTNRSENAKSARCVKGVAAKYSIIPSRARAPDGLGGPP
jgi:hypothetical protein